MALDDVLRMIDQLSPQEKQQVSAYIHQQTTFEDEIAALIASAPPTTLRAGTLDPDQFWGAVEGLWEGLTDETINAIVHDMNHEYIAQDDE